MHPNCSGMTQGKETRIPIQRGNWWDQLCKLVDLVDAATLVIGTPTVKVACTSWISIPPPWWTAYDLNWLTLRWSTGMAGTTRPWSKSQTSSQSWRLICCLSCCVGVSVVSWFRSPGAISRENCLEPPAGWTAVEEDGWVYLKVWSYFNPV
jgi:hypothetical protein